MEAEYNKSDSDKIEKLACDIEHHIFSYIKKSLEKVLKNYLEYNRRIWFEDRK